MELTSPDFEHGTLIPSRFTCDGEDVNPTLEIAGVPGDAQSLALVVDDPDSPKGTWTHWTLWNIDPDADSVISGAIPKDAVEGTTSFGDRGYGGPCPPSGTHRYFFKLYALSSKLELGSRSTIEELEEAMEGKILATAALMGLYSRDGE